MEGTIKYEAGKVTAQGRANVVVTLADGTEEKVWGKAAEMQQFRRGDRVRLQQKGKGFEIKLIQQQPPAAPTAPAIDKRAIADYAQQQARLYAYCYQQAIAAMPVDAPDAAIQAAASSVFIATGRKFHL